MAEEKIHGCLETGINNHQDDNSCVSEEIDQVDPREEEEEGDLSLRMIGKSNKDQLNADAGIFLSHAGCQ